MTLCRTCGEPLRSTGGECEDCEMRRRYPDHPPPKPDPLAAQQRDVTALLKDLGCPDSQEIWTAAVASVKTDLPKIIHQRALALAGLADTPLRSDNTSGHPGIDRHRDRWRARVWRGGKIVFSRSYSELPRAVAARARFLEGRA